MGVDANIQALIPVWTLYPPIDEDPSWRSWYSDIHDMRVSVFGHVELDYSDAEFFMTLDRSGVKHLIHVPDDICTSAEKTKAFAIDHVIKFVKDEGAASNER